MSIGQEAVAAGACAALDKDDLITTTHRGHGHCIAKGADPTGMFAELFGRSTGICGGKGGSMHIADPSLGILGANGIVGAGIPIATGGGLAAQVKGDGRVAVAFFGEGAVHSGAFHEGLTLAVAWQLPVIFLCENNGYAEFTASDSWAGPSIRERGASYGLSATSIDGSDPLLVESVVEAAVRQARDDGGPTFIEARTVRFHGHFEGDAQEYRPEEELAERTPRSTRSRSRLSNSVASVRRPCSVRRKRRWRRRSPPLWRRPTPRPTRCWRTCMPETPRYIQALNGAFVEEMERDDSVVVLGVDVGAGGGVYGVTKGLYERFGATRVRDAPIAEAGLLGAAVGAAMSGLRPVVEIMYMDFISVCLDPIMNQAAKLRYMTGGGVKVPLVFRTQTGGGRSGGAQHSQSLEGILAHIPGLRVFCPANARDAQDLLIAAIRDDNPVCFVENRRLYPRRDDEWDREPLPPGRARVIRPGDGITVVSWGRMVAETLRAIDGSGVDAELIDLRTLAPLDSDTVVESVRKTGRCLIVHEAVERFGPGAELVATVVEEALFDLDGPVERFGAQASPVPYSPTLEGAMLPTEESIRARLKAVATG